jgi:hypothetical protein
MQAGALTLLEHSSFSVPPATAKRRTRPWLRITSPRPRELGMPGFLPPRKKLSQAIGVNDAMPAEFIADFTLPYRGET